jgi:hypothetical protein
MITFELARKELADVKCSGGIETHRCRNDATWFELSDKWQILATLCYVCKVEVETYVNNQIQRTGD